MISVASSHCGSLVVLVALFFVLLPLQGTRIRSSDGLKVQGFKLIGLSQIHIHAGHHVYIYTHTVSILAQAVSRFL